MRGDVVRVEVEIGMFLDDGEHVAEYALKTVAGENVNTSEDWEGAAKTRPAIARDSIRETVVSIKQSISAIERALEHELYGLRRKARSAVTIKGIQMRLSARVDTGKNWDSEFEVERPGRRWIEWRGLYGRTGNMIRSHSVTADGYDLFRPLPVLEDGEIADAWLEVERGLDFLVAKADQRVAIER